jgi:hypothetical protein
VVDHLEGGVVEDVNAVVSHHVLPKSSYAGPSSVRAFGAG